MVFPASSCASLDIGPSEMVSAEGPCKGSGGHHGFVTGAQRNPMTVSTPALSA
eukprot:CAMPEP_0117655956 /NCGR_PEP_ID=MMETSP0804-20121206/4549_1 /TAXON_ID=1074897 /ORGANISM="Tetraselmis astigmatica, Strain CCMP880" /LENGTH=52 /DNA_ID=CAMNT_0005462329 /DNA_START=808 /DNA_END=966 /DNA_ORIENTATION=-